VAENVGSDQVLILAGNLKMLLLDVDGVLTDGGITLIGLDMEAKRFDVQDGMGITLAKASGLIVGIITGRKSEVVERRARELGIEDLCQGVGKKVEALDLLLQKHGLGSEETAYIGDDIQDLPVMKRVGLPIAVQNAVPEVKECSKYVTQAQGGHGAVREVVDWLLVLRGQKEQVYEKFID
jgi:3-deoxy-D-manno-octulosonate 8-phosphate phosphatase (KDO 8-P phosphatase)